MLKKIDEKFSYILFLILVSAPAMLILILCGSQINTTESSIRYGVLPNLNDKSDSYNNTSFLEENRRKLRTSIKANKTKSLIKKEITEKQ